MTNSSSQELKQKYLHERREFFLEPQRLRLFVKDLDGETENYIPYESITPNTRSITRQDGRVYIVAISCGIFAFVGFALNLAGMPSLMRWAPLWAVASMILLGFHFYKRRRYQVIDLSDGRSIYFLENKPSKENLQGFIKSLYEKRKKYLREKYFVLDPTNDPSSEVARFRFLLEEDIISESEFQEMRAAMTAQKIPGEFQSKGLIN